VSSFISLRANDCRTMILMQEKKLDVQIETSFEEFMNWLQEPKQTFALDTGNIKLTYNSVSVASYFKHIFTYFINYVHVMHKLGIMK